MANAAQEHRKLTSDEVASVTQAYLKLSESKVRLLPITQKHKNSLVRIYNKC